MGHVCRTWDPSSTAHILKLNPNKSFLAREGFCSLLREILSSVQVHPRILPQPQPLQHARGGNGRCPSPQHSWTRLCRGWIGPLTHPFIITVLIRPVTHKIWIVQHSSASMAGNLPCTLELQLNCKIFKPIQRCWMSSGGGTPAGLAAELMQTRI